MINKNDLLKCKKCGKEYKAPVNCDKASCCGEEMEKKIQYPEHFKTTLLDYAQLFNIRLSPDQYPKYYEWYLEAMAMPIK